MMQTNNIRFCIERQVWTYTYPRNAALQKKVTLMLVSSFYISISKGGPQQVKHSGS